MRDTELSKEEAELAFAATSPFPLAECLRMPLIAKDFWNGARHGWEEETGEESRG
jgi:hypothetical protein